MQTDNQQGGYDANRNDGDGQSGGDDEKVCGVDNDAVHMPCYRLEATSASRFTAWPSGQRRQLTELTTART